jgi:hypothetical protein
VKIGRLRLLRCHVEKASAGQTENARTILVAMGRGPTVANDLAQLNALRALPPDELRRALAPRTAATSR